MSLFISNQGHEYIPELTLSIYRHNSQLHEFCNGKPGFTSNAVREGIVVKIEHTL